MPQFGTCYQNFGEICEKILEKWQFYNVTACDFRVKSANIQTATSSIMKQFYISKHHKTQNVELYEVVISELQNFDFVTLKY